MLKEQKLLFRRYVMLVIIDNRILKFLDLVLRAISIDKNVLISH